MTRTHRRLATLSVTLGIALGAAGSATAVESDGWMDGDAAAVNAREAQAAERAAAGVDPAVRVVDYRRMTECDPLATGMAIDGSVCVPLTAATDLSTPPGCDGLDPVPPLWRRERTSPQAPWGPWVNILGWTCPQTYLTLTAADFARLPLDPPPLLIQPDRTEHLVNMPTIMWTEPTQQLLTTTLLGYPVEVEATPLTYTWHHGDGTHQTTTTPGAPYPHHDITHPYPRPGTYTITLTTTYTGRYRLAGTTTWATVDGTATTTTTAPPITVIEAPTHLVIGDCHTHPHDC